MNRVKGAPLNNLASSVRSGRISVLREGRRAGRLAARLLAARHPPAGQSALRARTWLHTHALSGGGVAVHANAEQSYPEVTGYVVPTLLHYGERELAQRFTAWLLSVQ